MSLKVLKLSTVLYNVYKCILVELYKRQFNIYTKKLPKQNSPLTEVVITR